MFEKSDPSDPKIRCIFVPKVLSLKQTHVYFEFSQSILLGMTVGKSVGRYKTPCSMLFFH